MKHIIVAFYIFTICVFNQSWAITLNPIDDYKKNELIIKMGELTGAGSKESIHNLVGFVFSEGVLMKEDCSSIIIKQTKNPMISDIQNIYVDAEEIDQSTLIGIVIH
jgi:hypothetical protein